MSNSERRFFSGVSLEQALMKAASHYGIDPEEVAYRPVEKRTGFIRKRRGVVIAVDPDQPRSPAGSGSAPAPTAPERPEIQVEPTPELPPPASVSEAPARVDEQPPAEPVPKIEPPRERPMEATGSLALAAERAATLALSFAGLEPRISVFRGEGRLELELSGGGEERLVAEGGDLLLSLEHLVPRMMRGLVDESMAVRVDCADFHERRRVRLTQAAERAAEEARSKGEEVALEPMAPDARRLVHIALQDDRTVSTRSVGRGLFKRVVIRPARS